MSNQYWCLFRIFDIYSKYDTFLLFISFLACALFPRFHLNWPQSVLVFFYILSGSNLNIELIRPECAGNGFSYFAKFMFMICIPIIFIITSLLHVAIASCITAIPKFRNVPRYLSYLQYVLGGFVSFLIACYVMQARWTLDLFACDQAHPSLPTTHAVYTEMLCSNQDPQFITFQVFAWISIAGWLIGVPVLIILFSVIIYATRFRNSRNPAAIDNQSAAQQIEDDEYDAAPATKDAKEVSKFSFLVVPGIEVFPSMQRIFGSIYGKYRVKHVYWEIIIMLRKILIVLATIFLTRFPVIATVVVSFIILSALVLHMAVRPYRKISTNMLEGVLLLVQYLMLILGTQLHTC